MVRSDYGVDRDHPDYMPVGLQGRFDPATCALNLKAANTRKVNAGMATAKDGSASLVILAGAPGDSILVGTDGHATICKQHKAIPVLVGRMLAKILGVPYSGGFIPCRPALSIQGSQWAITAGALAAGNVEYSNMNAGCEMLLTPLYVSKDFDLFYSGDSPAFNYSLDGAAPVGITPTGATDTTEKTTISVGAYGFHTLKVIALSNATKIVGADPKGPVGVRVHNLGMGGSSADWTTNSWVSGTGLTYRRSLLTHMPADPHLHLTNTGSNDMFQSGSYPNNGDTVAHAIAGYETLLDDYPNSDDLLLNVHEVESGVLQTNYTKFTAYSTAKYQMVDDRDAAMIDFRWREGIPVTVPVANGIIHTDGIHYKYGASEEMAKHIVRCLYPNPAIEVQVQPDGGPVSWLDDQILLAEN